MPGLKMTMPGACTRKARTVGRVDSGVDFPRPNTSRQMGPLSTAGPMAAGTTRNISQRRPYPAAERRAA